MQVLSEAVWHPLMTEDEVLTELYLTFFNFGCTLAVE